MNGIGIARRIDSLGRITIPMEVCKKLGIVRGQTLLEFCIQGNKIILKSEVSNLAAENDGGTRQRR